MVAIAINAMAANLPRMAGMLPALTGTVTLVGVTPLYARRLRPVLGDANDALDRHRR